MAASPLLTPKPSLVFPSKFTAVSRTTTPVTPTSLRVPANGHGETFDIDDIFEDDDWSSMYADPVTPETSPELISPPVSIENILQISEPSPPDDGTWRPLSARASHEQTVLVHPVNPHQKLIWKLDIRFHVQWELERRMASQDIVEWSDCVGSDLAVLQGSVAEALPRIESVMEAGRKRVFYKAQGEPADRADLNAREKEVSTILQRQCPSLNDSTKRMCTEADREERSIRAQDGKGSYSDDPDWQYGGKLIYTVYVQPITKSTKA
jgi:hypothetical protein